MLGDLALNLKSQIKTMCYVVDVTGFKKYKRNTRASIRWLDQVFFLID